MIVLNEFTDFIVQSAIGFIVYADEAMFGIVTDQSWQLVYKAIVVVAFFDVVILVDEALDESPEVFWDVAFILAQWGNRFPDWNFVDGIPSFLSYMFSITIETCTLPMEAIAHFKPQRL